MGKGPVTYHFAGPQSSSDQEMKESQQESGKSDENGNATDTRYTALGGD